MPASWYALSVRTNSEMQTCGALRAKCISTFLPTYTACRQYSDRIKKKEAALFPGYVFCRFELQAKLSILATGGVKQVVGDSSGPKAIEDSEIDAIRKVVSAQCSVKPWPFLRAGDRVRIGYGSMSGVEGILVRERGLDLLIIAVQILQRSVAIQVDRSWVQPL